ncbi:unnamed protein product [Allacma fusca]|uniref:Uncharacterized protein n=1 Tax=Allacma fusca TaxID=39272 RepID=A0A8J2KK75_9HEXA|nr:unnamed protein product [Allacma fusca]
MFIVEGDHFCRLCHYRTVLGRDWNTARNQQNQDFERQRALLDSQYGINSLRVKRVCLGSEVAGTAEGAIDGSEGVEERRRGAVEGVVGPGGVDVGQGAATGVVGDFAGEDIDKILQEI